MTTNWSSWSNVHSSDATLKEAAAQENRNSPHKIVPADINSDSRPYYQNNEWCLGINVNGENQTIKGKLSLASRRRERFTLEFRLDSSRRKKFYLCEFCQRAGSIVWIHYRNYAAQHIPRHHPAECETCGVCDRLVYRPQFEAHNRLCTGMNRKKRRKATNEPEYTVLAIPHASAEKTAEMMMETAKLAADDIERLLLSSGASVVTGAQRDCIGYPVESSASTTAECVVEVAGKSKSSMEGEGIALIEEAAGSAEKMASAHRSVRKGRSSGVPEARGESVAELTSQLMAEVDDGPPVASEFGCRPEALEFPCALTAVELGREPSVVKATMCTFLFEGRPSSCQSDTTTTAFGSDGED